MDSLAGLLTSLAEKYADRPALLAPDRAPLTYAHLNRLVAERRSELQSLGYGSAHRIAIVLPNGPEMAAAFLTVASLATAAPLNPTFNSAEFEFYLSDLEASALLLLSGDESPARAVALARGIPLLELTVNPDQAAGAFALSGEPPLQPCPPDSPDDIALILHTSGTTSRPKMVPLTRRNLLASADSIRRTLRLTPADRCLNVMPLFHIHGLVAALLASLSAGASVVCTSGFDAPRFFAQLDAFAPTWYTAVPTMHQSILSRAEAHPDALARSRLRLIRSSSAALPPPVMAALESAFRCPVIEAYGMTEASHQIASNPLPPAERRPGSVGLAAGPEVAIMAEQSDELLASGETGEIVIRGPGVTRGYVNNPEANARAFSSGWFRTGDLGRLDPDGYLWIEGRLKEIISRGGEKISPRQVDEVLLTHPSVAQAVTFAIPDPTLGEDVAAAVVLRRKDVSEGDLRRFVSLHLAHFKVPRRILVLDELPKGPTGKIQRIGLAGRLGLTAAALAPVAPPLPFSPPVTELEQHIASIWATVLGLSAVSRDSTFLELGGDSLLATRVLNRLHQSLQVQMTMLEFFDASTVAGLARLIEPRLPPRTGTPTLPPPSMPA